MSTTHARMIGARIRQPRSWRFLVPVVMLSLVIAACGSGSDEGTETTSGTTGTTAAQTTTTAMQATTTEAATETTMADTGMMEPLPSGFPDGPITLWAAFGAGHPDDLLNRKVAEIAADYSPVRITTDTNEVGPGLAYTLAADVLPTLPRADEGYQIYTANFPALALRPYTKEAIATSDISDLHEIAGVYEIPAAYAVAKDSDFTSLDDVIQYAKDNPGKLRYVAGGTGSRGQLQALAWIDEAGIEATFVPTESAAESSQVLQGGGAEIFVNGVHSMDLDAMNLVAVTGSERLSISPDTPTMSELGYTSPIQTMGSYALSGYGSLAEVPAENQQWIVDLLTRVVNDARFSEAYPYAKAGIQTPEQVQEAEQAALDVLYPILVDLGLNVKER